MQATGNNQLHAYHLSIRLHADGFSFFSCSLSGEEPPVTAEHYVYEQGESAAVSMEHALVHSALIRNHKHASVYILVADVCMQVPLKHFDKSEAQALYNLTFHNEKRLRTYYNILPHIEVALVFGIDHDTDKVLSRHFPQMRVYHAHTMLLEKIKLTTDQVSTRLYVYLHGEEAFVFHMNDRQLQYANTFKADHPDTTAYYILSVWKQEGLDQEQDVCVLFGNTPNVTAVASSLSPYIRKVSATTAIELFRRSPLARIRELPTDLVALLGTTI